MASVLGRVKRSGASLLGLAVLFLIVAVQAADPAPLARIRMQVFDTYQAISPRIVDQGAKVAIVDIDEEAIEELGQWPWPRTDIARMTQRLGEAGASVVVFDIVFSEPDRTSPEAVAEQLERQGNEPSLARALQNLQSHDARLAESFNKVPVVTAYFLDKSQRGRAVEPKAPFTIAGTLPRREVPSYPGAIRPLPELEAAASGSGFVSLESDPDGIVRRIPLVALQRDTLLPSLSLEALRVAIDAGSPNLLASDGSGETLASPGAAVAVRIGDREIPVTETGEMWVHFPDPAMREVIPAAPLVTGEMSDDALAGKVEGRVVFVGGSAAGLQDLVSTPLSERIAGVSVHAAALEQMLAGQFIERPDWALSLELLLVLMLGIGFSLVLPRLGALQGAIAATGAILAVIGASWFGFAESRYLFDPTYPVLAIALIYTVQTVAVFYREEQQRSYIRSAFDRFLSPEMVKQIADDPSKLNLGGEERDMSVMMCDIRGFSRISEEHTPSEVIDFLIEFLTPMSEILLDHRATLDKYIGDAILAFWNAPLDDPDHHRHAAKAALAMVDAVAELNRTKPLEEGSAWPGEVRIGIGLNSGLCCVGNMGSEQRLAYSLIGDTVNVAARLEGLTKQYGVPIIVGEEMAGHLGGFSMLEIDRVRVVGRDRAERIFALLEDEDAASCEPVAAVIEAHTGMLEAYRERKWGLAAEVLSDSEGIYAKAGLTGLAALFERRIAALKSDPPEPDWGGVFAATQK
ncbi:CHASE2 domain-containing protein [Erythrobacter sp. THAF29]|uniref:CHASE2 domain-containing protein n=1 Tax=Erythrobacter sp. THAF29 TaxID=2587851 RepID=UPI0012688D7F|nr:adenylate/guanylate cyclase domain-containing protein [Erythrobacter sp. THAF29]QFT78496.1 Adenylate cyclase 1 [Erythrobacter sp. THAF29]